MYEARSFICKAVQGDRALCIARRYRGNSHCMRKLCALEKAASVQSADLGFDSVSIHLKVKFPSWEFNGAARRRCIRRGRAYTYTRCIQMRPLCPSRGLSLRRSSINPPWHANNSWKKSFGYAAATLQLITRTVAATPRPATGSYNLLWLTGSSCNSAA